MLLLIAAIMIAQPNVRVLEGAFSGFLGGWGEDGPELEAVVDQLTVEAGRVSGRVRNPSAVAFSRVDVSVRLIPEQGEARTASATGYDLAAGSEAWFGVPLVGGPAVARAEIVDVRTTAGTEGAEPDAAPRRRGGVGGMQDVERLERELKQMEEATRAATGR